MIQDVDATIRRMLLAELADVFQCPVQREEQITFEAPGQTETAPTDEPRVNLYLFDVRENTALRETGRPVARDRQTGMAARRRPPMMLDLSYLVTTYAVGDPGLEHRLLTDVLRALIRQPVVPARFLQGALSEEDAILVSVAQPGHPAYTEAPGLWQALGGRLRPSLGLTVTAPFYAAEPKWGRVVLEAVIGLGIGTPPEGPRRPLEIGGVRVSVAGVVAAKEDEQPVEGVLVSVLGRNEQTRTDARGFFYLVDLPPQKYTLSFKKRGFDTREDIEVSAPPSGRPDLLQPTIVALHAMKAPKRRVAEAALVEADWNRPGFSDVDRVYHVSLTGRLCRADGGPAAYIPVRAGRKETTTDSEGVYSFVDLPDAAPLIEADVPGIGTVSVGAGGERGDQIIPFPPLRETVEGHSPESEPPAPARASRPSPKR